MIVAGESSLIYSKVAKFYDILLWLFGYKLAVHYFINLLPFRKDEAIRALDAGAGTGLYTFALFRKFGNAKVSAFDLNEDMIHAMKRSVAKMHLSDRVTTFVGNVVKPLSLPVAEFDLIMTGGVLEYVDPKEAVRNLTQHLKRGGYFLHSPVKDSSVGRLIGLVYGFKPHSQKANLNAFLENGFVLRRRKILPIKEAYLFQKI